VEFHAQDVDFWLMASTMTSVHIKVKVKVTVKYTPKQAMKAQRRSRFKPLLFL